MSARDRGEGPWVRGSVASSPFASFASVNAVPRSNLALFLSAQLKITANRRLRNGSQTEPYGLSTWRMLSGT